MSLERKLRVAFQQGELHAGDEEGRGLRLLKDGYALLLQGRAKQKDLLGGGTELGSPDLLVLAAEAAVKNEDFETAAVEFCRLFILNPAAPARAAAYQEKNSLEVADRIQFMLDSGFLELPATFQTLAPDHVALLLLVYSSLDGDDAIQFKADNLAWLPEFSERLEKESKHAFYLLASKILRVV